LFKLVKAQRERGGPDGRSMGKCWDGVIGHIGAVSEKHKQLATVLGDIGRTYSEEAGLLAEEQRDLEQSSKKLQSDLDSSILDLERTKEKYFRRQLEAEKSEDALLRSEDDEKVTADELEKLRDAADEKKAKYNKAREEYSAQLSSTNILQSDFYQNSWPNLISGMRGVAERGVESIISLLRRLDLLARDEWGDLGLVSDEMENSMEDDFDVFLNWVKSGNLPPTEFTFEETCKPGMLPLGTMGTLRKSISRASLRLSGSTMTLGGRGLGSRASLRSPTYNHSPRFRSVREGQSHHFSPRFRSVREERNYFPNQSTTIRESNELSINGSMEEEQREKSNGDMDGEEHGEQEQEGEEEEEINEKQVMEVNGVQVNTAACDALNDVKQTSITGEKEDALGDNPFEDEALTNGSEEKKVISSPKSGRSNGTLKNKYMKQDSYDDRMNPFTRDFDND